MAAVDTIFKLNDVDFSDHVVAEGYQVNLKEVYQEWKDGSQKKHKDVVAKKILGKFQMFFETDNELQAFVTALSSCKQLDNTYPVKLKINNNMVASLSDTKYVFIDYEPVRKKYTALSDFYEVFEVMIEEP